MDPDSRDRPTTTPGEAPERSETGEPDALRLVNMSISADRKHVHIHFVTRKARVITVQLERAFADEFSKRLAGLVAQMSSADETSISLWH